MLQCCFGGRHSLVDVVCGSCVDCRYRIFCAASCQHTVPGVSLSLIPLRWIYGGDGFSGRARDEFIVDEKAKRLLVVVLVGSLDVLEQGMHRVPARMESDQQRRRCDDKRFALSACDNTWCAFELTAHRLLLSILEFWLVFAQRVRGFAGDPRHRMMCNKLRSRLRYQTKARAHAPCRKGLPKYRIARLSRCPPVWRSDCHMEVSCSAQHSATRRSLRPLSNAVNKVCDW